MILTIHQKILLRGLLAKFSINANKDIALVNNRNTTIRRKARENLCLYVWYCIGSIIPFYLHSPYSKAYKNGNCSHVIL